MASSRSDSPAEVFLAHSSRNRTFVKKLARVLRQHGVPVWYSKKNIVGAQQWHDEIGRALARCDWFAVVLSPSSVASKWVRLEYLYALRRSRYENRIIPISYRLCDTTKLSWTIDSFEFVDFTRKFADGCLELLRIWGIGYDTSSTAKRKKARPRK